jgi:hypothetical protein
MNNPRRLTSGKLQLLELPAVLVKDIVEEAASTMELYAAFRLREVNSEPNNIYVARQPCRLSL